MSLLTIQYPAGIQDLTIWITQLRNINHLPVPESGYTTFRTHSRPGEHNDVLRLRQDLAKCTHPEQNQSNPPNFSATTPLVFRKYNARSFCKTANVEAQKQLRAVLPSRYFAKVEVRGPSLIIYVSYTRSACACVLGRSCAHALHILCALGRTNDVSERC